MGGTIQDTGIILAPLMINAFQMKGCLDNVYSIYCSLIVNKMLHSFDVLHSNAVLRLECSIDCVSGSVGHQQNIFRSFSQCQRFF